MQSYSFFFIYPSYSCRKPSFSFSPSPYCADRLKFLKNTSTCCPDTLVSFMRDALAEPMVGAFSVYGASLLCVRGTSRHWPLVKSCSLKADATWGTCTSRPKVEKITLRSVAKVSYASGCAGITSLDS